MKKMTVGLALMLALGGGTALAADDDLVKAGALMRQGKAAEAYRLLAPKEFDRAGEVDYDYVLGVAALDSGKPDRATLALERVLAVNPNFAGARLDLARAYFALGDYDRAKNEFEAVLSQNPPATARTVSEQYLAAIEDKKNPKPSLTGYLEGSFGYDTNVNSAANANEIYMPLFGATFTLSSASVASRDNYLSLGGGFEYKYPLRNGWSLVAGLDGKKRVNFFKDAFNTDNADARLGVMLDRGDNVYKLTANKGVFYLDDKFNRETSGAVGEWRHNLNRRNQLAVFGQYTMLRYGHDKTGVDLSSQDVNQTVIGGGWIHALDDAGQKILFLSAYNGQERTTGPVDRLDGDQRFWGARLGGQMTLNPKLDAFAVAGAKFGNYTIKNILFRDYRYDEQYDLSLGMSWRPVQDWTVRPQVSYTRVDSNVALNDYDRIDASLTVRRDFK
jgi:tetratricopeptide (TPR) repeat protein